MAAGEARHTEIMNGRPGSAASTHTTDGAVVLPPLRSENVTDRTVVTCCCVAVTTVKVSVVPSVDKDTSAVPAADCVYQRPTVPVAPSAVTRLNAAT